MYRPDILNYGTLRPNQHEANLNNAFNVAEESLGIAKLLDPEGIVIWLYKISYFHTLITLITFLPLYFVIGLLTIQSVLLLQSIS